MAGEFDAFAAEVEAYLAGRRARLRKILAAQDEEALLAFIEEDQRAASTPLPRSATKLRIKAYFESATGVEASESLGLNPKVYRKWVLRYDLPWKTTKRGRPQLAGPDRYAILASEGRDADKAARAGMTLDGWRTWVRRHGRNSKTP